MLLLTILPQLNHSFNSSSILTRSNVFQDLLPILISIFLLFIISITSLIYLNSTKNTSSSEISNNLDNISSNLKTNNVTNPTTYDSIKATLSPEELKLINLLKIYNERFHSEINNLNSKSNYNLTIGLIATTIGALFLLFTIILPPATNQDHWIYITQLVTRFSIIIFFEFFAFFFLRLYKNIQEDIKYYQNEISNIELKTFAVMITLANNDISLLKPIIEQLATTERNFVLKKGETTVGLEREKRDKNEIFELVHAMMNTQPRNKK